MPVEIHGITPVSAPAEAGVRAVSRVAPRAAVRDAGEREADNAPPLTPSSSEREALEQATRELNDYYQLRKAALRFSIDEDTQRLVVTVTDARDGTLIRQIPSAEALRLAQALQREITPQLLQHKV